eukprot:TRINITY_DN4588_c0_g1_i1.p1 TRINITY_DN4588_c0_g1~~TRINITY_DN4588_c0_g1_i1.p1  ORF type:complete len:283 (+),score=88.53 TRINITY_DN4588_c0_g1_i1:61-909(+)
MAEASPPTPGGVQAVQEQDAVQSTSVASSSTFVQPGPALASGSQVPTASPPMMEGAVGGVILPPPPPPSSVSPPRDLPPPDYDTAVGGMGGEVLAKGAAAVAGGYLHQPARVQIPNEPPPDYSVAANLPSYDQAERAKNKYYEEDPIVIEDIESPRFSGHHGSSAWDEESDAALLGNDVVFCAAFVLAFLLNWVGFLLLMCFCHTIAARYGALAGFGLSLVKWTLIVKRSTELVRTENAWLWWLVLGFGFLICTRTCIQYLQIKKTWRHLSRSARERLFFFY